MIGELFRARADALERDGRSPLYVELMRGAAADADAGGIVAAIFAGDPAAPESVPQLRLLAALHRLVLAGEAPELARHFPSAGGERPPAGAWEAARRALVEHEGCVRKLVRRTVQTNEPGRCAALYGALLWLSERHRLPVRLLEIGASAGLNLHVDRFRYVVGGAVLGDPASALELREPWIGAPLADPRAAAAALQIAERGGCDRAPIDPATRAGRLELLSYIWPDEPERLARVEQAATIAARHHVAVERRGAAEWLAERLAAARADVVTVVWQSCVNQYLDEDEREALADVLAEAGRLAAPGAPVAWVRMEPPQGDFPPGREGLAEVRVHLLSGGPDDVVGYAGYHGRPVHLAP